MRLIRRFFDPWLSVLISSILVVLVQASIPWVAHVTRLGWLIAFDHGFLGHVTGWVISFAVALIIGVNLQPYHVHRGFRWLVLPMNKARVSRYATDRQGHTSPSISLD
ncbi:hypothetical protein [Ferrimicrobium sp.]|uniref:hypothetical protein n=1 Tax=Ferrimicrobium sp. TaxID=2926050 RepID=UPI0026394B45|nr:hypothetical protein [Ferrimicrobium sp.]